MRPLVTQKSIRKALVRPQPTFENEHDQFVWTATCMGGLDFRLVQFRDEFRLKCFIGTRDVTRNIVSFVRRGFLQMRVVNHKVTIILPHEPGWIEK